MIDPSVTLYPSVFKASEGGDVLVSAIIKKVERGEYQTLIQRIRALAEKEQQATSEEERDKYHEERNNLKKQLPAACFGGKFGRRSVEGLEEASGLLTADIDDLTPEEAARGERNLKADPYCVACFRSPSGQLKALFKGREVETAEDYRHAWETLRQYLKNTYKLSLDEAAKDISRATYLSSDPQAYFNPEADEFSWTRQEKTGKRNDYGKVLSGEVEVGERNNQLFKLSCSNKHRGLAFDACLANVRATNKGFKNPLKDGEVTAIVKSAYKYPDEEKKPAEEPKTITPLTGAEVLEASTQKINYVVDKVIPERGIVVFAAPPGSYKSALALTMLLQGGEGKPFLDKFKVEEEFKGLFVDMEAGVVGLGTRLRQLMGGHDVETIKSLFLCDESILLDYPEVAEATLGPIIEQNEIKVVVVDAIVRAMVGDENAASDVRKVFATLRKLRDTYGVSFVLVHHLTKGLNGQVTLESLRGSGDFGAMTDAVWSFKANAKGEVTVACLKHRYLPLHQLQPFALKVENPEGDLDKIRFEFQGVKEKPESVVDKAKRLLKEWISMQGGSEEFEFSIPQAHAALKNKGCTRDAVYRAAKALKSNGEINQNPNGRGFHVNGTLDGYDAEEIEEDV